ncbi:16S rRNA methyltransferase [Alicyclobacillus ferrooxydans]|uniref:Ribosomal RNA small subunit methyltransferase A n=1 Tax=Alicyclobacillus ferrooxydans TaxID=471514 RepID=A0A0N8PPL2_9BACL|nr:16S rRNA (adenine(1518)-N(6)/adenine(1519)-N(6))-dimethyltransferase RsmA [Alicyclobacillus ferrooxydans]KPV44637.1 16S rRNA methyltransferase [Alicyclobacillus ferrooxydans]
MSDQIDLARLSSLRELLQTHGFQFKKQLGQNFLVDARVLERIVDAADLIPGDGVFEIGPGAGVVTQVLAQQATQVVAVEKDRALAPVLDTSLAGLNNVKVVYADVLDVNLNEVWNEFSNCARVSVVANLPYYVTTPILFHLLESGVPLHNVVVMVQKEVADRLVSGPGTKDYGALSVAVQYYAEVDKVLRVHPGAFIPPPNVESEVVRLRVRKQPAVIVPDQTLFFRVVRAGFAMRRKTLLNNLSHSFGFTKPDCEHLLLCTGIEPRRRGETLSLDEFARLTSAIYEKLHSNKEYTP